MLVLCCGPPEHPLQSQTALDPEPARFTSVTFILNESGNTRFDAPVSACGSITAKRHVPLVRTGASCSPHHRQSPSFQLFRMLRSTPATLSNDAMMPM